MDQYLMRLCLHDFLGGRLITFFHLSELESSLVDSATIDRSLAQRGVYPWFLLRWQNSFDDLCIVRALNACFVIVAWFNYHWAVLFWQITSKFIVGADCTNWLLLFFRYEVVRLALRCMRWLSRVMMVLVLRLWDATCSLPIEAIVTVLGEAASTLIYGGASHVRCPMILWIDVGVVTASSIIWGSASWGLAKLAACLMPCHVRAGWKRSLTATWMVLFSCGAVILRILTC